MLNMRLAALTVTVAIVCTAFSLAVPTAAHAQAFTVTANLSGLNEVPSGDSKANGVAQISYDGVGSLTYLVAFSNLSSNATTSFIQLGATGINGPTIFQFTPGPSGATSGFFNGTLTSSNLIARPSNGINTFADAINAIRFGNTYLNLNSVDFPNGAIRGQLLLPAVAPEPGSLSLIALAAVSAGGFGLRRRLRRSVS